MSVFASEQDDRGDDGSVDAVLPAAADRLRAAPDQSLRLTLAQPATRRVYRVATRVAVAAAIVAIAAAGAYLYAPKPARLDEQIADIRADTQRSPALAESEATITTAPLPREAINRPGPRNTERASPPAAVKDDLSGPAPSEAAVAAPDADRGPAEPPPLSGDWVMNTRVESSRLKRYEGLRLGYRVTLSQDGNRIRGTGWKVSEDERTIGATARTPISFDGTLNDDRLELTFTEGGRRRVTAGKLVLARDSDDALRGRFFSTAAQSFGVVEILR